MARISRFLEKDIFARAALYDLTVQKALLRLAGKPYDRSHRVLFTALIPPSPKEGPCTPLRRTGTASGEGRGHAAAGFQDGKAHQLFVLKDKRFRKHPWFCILFLL